MKIVILDGYTANPGDLSWEPFEQFGECVVYDRTNSEDVVSRIGDAEIVIPNKVVISREIIESCPSIKYIGEFATGYNNVDCTAAKEKGIIVTNIPTYGTAAVAQFAIALLLEICHHIGQHNKAVHFGKWTGCQDFCFWDYPLIELSGKTMGIVGLGRIGQTTAKIAGALGMKVLAYDQFECEPGRDVAEYTTLDSVLSLSDIVVLHCPLTPETNQFINSKTIAKMKDGAILINNSRGQLVNEMDLADALNTGKLAAAGLDVVSSEPIRENNPLLTAKNCIITPHISWAAKECRQRMINMSVENLRAFIEGNPINVVNK